MYVIPPNIYINNKVHCLNVAIERANSNQNKEYPYSSVADQHYESKYAA
jgi:hypothetical protein